jgi:DNA-3-methyladenine glycosylase II
VSLTPGSRRSSSSPSLTTTAFRIIPLRPYSLALTASRFCRFPEIVDRFDGATYRRLLLVDGEPHLLSVTQTGTPLQATLQVQVTGAASGSAARAEARQLIERALGATSDVRPFYRALKDDPILGPGIRVFRGLRIAGWPDVWEAAASTVLCQQVNLAFAYGIRQDLAKSFGLHARFNGESFYAFPTPQSIAQAGVQRLRHFRLSQAKAETLGRLAATFSPGGNLTDSELRSLPDDVVIERLTAIKGVGPWTAETVLLRGLGRIDAFPAGDLGVVKYLAQELLGRAEPATEKEMRQYAERWKPYRGLALVYAYAELQRLRVQAEQERRRPPKQASPDASSRASRPPRDANTLARNRSTK